MNSLSAQVEGVIRRLFAPGEAEAISRLILEECSVKLPLTQTASQREPIQLAVLKLCRGDPDRLVSEIRSAQRDWRDTLVAAGFGSDLEAHHRWAKEIIAE
jgi:hypothetical protein